MKRAIVIISALNFLLICALCYIGYCRTDYFRRVYARIEGKTYVPARSDDDCVASWNGCIRKLDLDVDVVFFGDSITEGGEWQTFFPNKKTITLAYIGEDTKGMLRRVATIAEVKPEKVFLMAGINGLKVQSLSEFERWYSALLDSICFMHPEAQIFVQSILPVTAESMYCSNRKIEEANSIIDRLVSNMNTDLVEYVDLWKVYAKDGCLPNQYSYDGLHLKDDAYTYWVNAISKFVE